MNNQELDQLLSASVERHDRLRNMEQDILHEIRHRRRLHMLKQVMRWCIFAVAMSITLVGCLTLAQEYLFTGEGITLLKLVLGIGFGATLWISERLISHFSIDKM